MGDAPRHDDITPIQQAQAYADGRSDDIARELVAELLASHLALQEAGEEMPDNLIALVSDRNGIAHGADVLTTKAILVPLFARRTQERDEARASAKRGWDAAHEHVETIATLRQRVEREMWELAVERSAHGGARVDASHLKTQLDAALARIAEPPSASMLRDWPNGIMCCNGCYNSHGDCADHGNCSCHRRKS